MSGASPLPGKPIDYTDHSIDWRKCPSRDDVEHHAGLHRSVDTLMTERDAARAEAAWLREELASIVLHADIAAGESWEQAYNEVTQMARDAIGGY